MDNNPCRDIIIESSTVIYDKPVWSEDVLSAFLDWCQENIKFSYYLGFLIAATTASRRGEICAIKYTDIKEGYLHKNRGMDRYGSQTNMKTHVSHRGIYIMDITLSAIEEQKRRQTAIIGMIGDQSAIYPSVRPWDYVLTDDWNKPIKPNVLTKNFRKAVRRYQNNWDIPSPEPH